VTGDQRWQIGGWKQESDGSPFVAQRFDHGIFHITLESGDSRVLVASSAGEARSFFAQLRDGIASRFAFVSDASRFDGHDNVTIEYGDDPILPDPRADWVDMVYRIKGGLEDDGIVEIYANGRFIARATGTIGVFGAQDPTQYFRFGVNRAPMPGTAHDLYRPLPPRRQQGGGGTVGSMEAVMALPAWQSWKSAAEAETWTIPAEEV
jgi:hypothetical protein